MNGQMLLERTCFRRTSSTTNFSPAPCIGKIWREKREQLVRVSIISTCLAVSVFLFLHSRFYFSERTIFGEEHVAYVAGTTFFTFAFDDPCSQVPL